MYKILIKQESVMNKISELNWIKSNLTLFPVCCLWCHISESLVNGSWLCMFLWCHDVISCGSKVCTSQAASICMNGNANVLLPPGITDPLGAKHGWEEIENRAAQLVSDQEKEQTVCVCVFSLGFGLFRPYCACSSGFSYLCSHLCVLIYLSL